MKLNELLKGIEYDGEILEQDEIDNIAYDSRKVSKGGCFIAIKGHMIDGNNFINSASLIVDLMILSVIFRNKIDACSDA